MNPAASTNNFGGEGITVPALRDVLNGRGQGVQRHLGNINYRKLVYLNKALYAMCPKNDKAKISKGIVEAVRERGGRFLQLNKSENIYFDIGDKKATEKTSQALREDLVPLRQTMLQEGYLRGSSGKSMDLAYDTSLLTSSTDRVPTSESITPPEATKGISEEGYFGYSVQVLEALQNDSDVGLFDIKMGGIGGVDGTGRREDRVIGAAGVAFAGGRSTLETGTGTGTGRNAVFLRGGVGVDHIGESSIDLISTPPEPSTQSPHVGVPARGVASSINQRMLHPTNTDQLSGRETSWNSGSTEDSHVGVVYPGGSSIDSISTPPEPSTQSPHVGVPARSVASSINQRTLHPTNTDQLSGREASLVPGLTKQLHEAWLAVNRLLHEESGDDA